MYNYKLGNDNNNNNNNNNNNIAIVGIATVRNHFGYNQRTYLNTVDRKYVYTLIMATVLP